MNPRNPLKVLHKLLDQTVTQTKKTPKQEGARLFDLDNFTFISISNWKLDLSKMSRSVFITRPDLAEKDLNLTARDLMLHSHNNLDDTGNDLTPVSPEVNDKIESECLKLSKTYFFMRQNKQMV